MSTRRRDDDAPYGDVGAIVDFFEQQPEISVVLEGAEVRPTAMNAAARALFGGRLRYGEPMFAGLDETGPQGWADAVHQVFATGEPVVGHEWRADLRQPDGTMDTFWLDFWYRPRFDAEGRVVGVFAKGVDVTDKVLLRRRMDAQVRTLTERYAQAREVVATLQRALLPANVPVLPGVELGARYVVAADEQAAGGDWFDTLPRDGRVVLIVGDVVGHGLAAASTMGRLRAVLLDHLEAGESLVEAIGALHRRARRDRRAFATTVCIVDLDPVTGDLDYVTAGHPPPLVLNGRAPEAEAARYLVPTGSGPLGAAGPVVVGHDTLGEHEVLLLYSDGIIELPRKAPAQGTVDLARTAHRAILDLLRPSDRTPLAVDRVTAQTIDVLTQPAGHVDDITVVAAQRVPPVAPVAHRLAADADTVGEAQAVVRHWLRGLHVAVDEADALLQVVTELVENVVDHAYAGGVPGDVELGLELGADGVARMRVVDHGRWRTPTDDPERGLGLAMSRTLVDTLEVVGSDQGTTATAHHPLSRPAGPLVDLVAHTTGTAAGQEETCDIWSHQAQTGPVVGANGPLDARSVPELEAHLALAFSDDARVVTLDLGGVTLLASAAVHALLRAVEGGRRAGTELVAVAPPGSAAHHILTLVGQGHLTVPRA